MVERVKCSLYLLKQAMLLSKRAACTLPSLSYQAGSACRRWLLGLLVLQSMSSVVLENYEQLIKDHLVVTLFLTMLVGAGGNAGNQSAIKVIRGLVTPVPCSQACQSRRDTANQQLTCDLSIGYQEHKLDTCLNLKDSTSARRDWSSAGICFGRCISLSLVIVKLCSTGC